MPEPQEGIIREYNLYCDESRVENPNSLKMVIGSVTIPRTRKKTIYKKLNEILEISNFKRELKWSKVHKNNLGTYKKLIDYYLSENSLNFRCIIVDKESIQYETYHDNDKELAFFKFYYLMLRPQLLDYNKYYIFIDRKPTRDKNRARALKSFLDSYVLLKRKECSIEHLQAYSSKENLLIQLSDLLTGLFSYACNNAPNQSAKSNLAQYLQTKLNRTTLCTTTPLQEEKCNVFVWKGSTL